MDTKTKTHDNSCSINMTQKSSFDNPEYNTYIDALLSKKSKLQSQIDLDSKVFDNLLSFKKRYVLISSVLTIKSEKHHTSFNDVLDFFVMSDNLKDLYFLWNTRLWEQKRNSEYDNFIIDLEKREIVDFLSTRIFVRPKYESQ